MDTKNRNHLCDDEMNAKPYWPFGLRQQIQDCIAVIRRVIDRLNRDKEQSNG